MGLSKEAAFNKRVQLVPFSSCHYWTGEVHSNGYGVFRRQRAHRVSYERIHGPIPREIDGARAVIRHRCDTPLCVNPDHLEIGTQAQNVADAKERKRFPRRLRHHWGRHNDVVIDGVCNAIIAGKTNREIMVQWGVSAPHISSIRFGKAERERFVALGGKVARARSDRLLSDEQAIAAFNMEGVLAEIGRHFGVSAATIRDIKKGHSYARITGVRG